VKKKQVSSTLGRQEKLDGDDAAAALLAAIGSPQKKSVAQSLGICSTKTKRLKEQQKSTKGRWDSISLQAPDRSRKKLTLIDLKLRAMVEAAKPGKAHTLQEIADFVGVSRERIRQIEEVGMRKLRNKMFQICKEDNIDREEFQR
jgi:DNA-directed RNA polymerase specialized sigma subunit